MATTFRFSNKLHKHYHPDQLSGLRVFYRHLLLCSIPMYQSQADAQWASFMRKATQGSMPERTFY